MPAFYVVACIIFVYPPNGSIQHNGSHALRCIFIILHLLSHCNVRFAAVPLFQWIVTPDFHTDVGNPCLRYRCCVPCSGFRWLFLLRTRWVVFLLFFVSSIHAFSLFDCYNVVMTVVLPWISIAWKKGSLVFLQKLHLRKNYVLEIADMHLPVL